MTTFHDEYAQNPETIGTFIVVGAETTAIHGTVDPRQVINAGAAVRSFALVSDADTLPVLDDSRQALSVVMGDAQVGTLVAPETEAMPVYTPRRATRSDIPGMVDLDLRSFDSVYQDYDQSEDQLRAEMTEKFESRFDLVGGDWINVLEDESGEMHGIIMGFRTDRTPEDFTSWEDMTSNGTFEDAYDPEGDRVYVATMSASSEAAKRGANEMLQVHLLGQMVREGVGQAFFESRMPGFRGWVARREREEGRSIRDFDSDSERAREYAEQYAASTIELKDGTEVARDKLLRIYDDFGARQAKVVPNAYSDGPSLNFGVVYTMDNPLMDKLHLPERVAKNRIVASAAGLALQAASKRPGIMERL